MKKCKIKLCKRKEMAKVFGIAPARRKRRPSEKFLVSKGLSAICAARAISKFWMLGFESE